MTSLQFNRNAWRESFYKTKKPERKEGGVGVGISIGLRVKETGSQLSQRPAVSSQANKSSNLSILISCPSQEDN